MRNTILTAVSVIMALFPWTILPMRAYTQWALDYAHIIIPCYAVCMILFGVCTVLAYAAGKAKNAVMKVCLVINSVYGAFGVMVIVMLIAQRRMG